MQSVDAPRNKEGTPWATCFLPCNHRALPTLISVLTTRAQTGHTPRRLIWWLNKAREYRYEPVLSAEKRHRVPLLLVYAPIGRPAILGNEGLRNLILLTSPLDYSAKDAITLARLVDDRWFSLEQILCTFGNIPGEMIALGAGAAGPVESFIRPFCRLCDHLDDPEFVRHWHAHRTWAADLVSLTGALFRDLVVELQAMTGDAW